MSLSLLSLLLISSASLLITALMSSLSLTEALQLSIDDDLDDEDEARELSPSLLMAGKLAPWKSTWPYGLFPLLMGRRPGP